MIRSELSAAYHGVHWLKAEHASGASCPELRLQRRAVAIIGRLMKLPSLVIMEKRNEAVRVSEEDWSAISRLRSRSAWVTLRAPVHARRTVVAVGYGILRADQCAIDLENTLSTTIPAMMSVSPITAGRSSA